MGLVPMGNRVFPCGIKKGVSIFPCGIRRKCGAPHHTRAVPLLELQRGGLQGRPGYPQRTWAQDKIDEGVVPCCIRKKME